MFDTLRSRLLAILISFTCCIIAISVASFRYFEYNKDSLSEVTQKIEKTHLLLLKDINVMHNFFENETINPSFFKTAKSPLLEEHRELFENIKEALIELYDLQKKNDFELNQQISSFSAELSKYGQFTDTIISQILIRGFKDYGTEGKMRKYAHLLESYEKEIGLINILQLRRHEKDFIIRQETKYIAAHKQLTETLKSKLEGSLAVNNTKKEEIKTILNNYQREFGVLVKYEKKLGLKNGFGMKGRIDNLSLELESSLFSMEIISKQQEAIILEHVKLAYILAGILFIIVSVFFAVIISKRVFSSITDLKDSIDEFVKSDFSKRTILPIAGSSNEIDILSTNFSIMEQCIVDQMKTLKQTNKDLEMLFYATSHDIQLPLLEVKALTEEAIAKIPDPQAQNFFLKINSSWDQLLNIVDELGIVTNVRNVEIQTELIDIENLVKSIFTEFKMLPWFDNIIFSLEIKLTRKFYSSKSLLKIIFRNLIENGIKYATKRSSFSFLKISVSNGNDEMVKIQVSDNGIGIKKEYQDKIFDMFFRGTTYTSGTGLGLYIVQSSLEKLNGAISVFSEENSGTTFMLLIPNSYKKSGAKEQMVQEEA
jgi:signal transduction histidine kinase